MKVASLSLKPKTQRRTIVCRLTDQSVTAQEGQEWATPRKQHNKSASLLGTTLHKQS